MHTAVWVDCGKSSHKLSYGKAMLFAAGLLLVSILPARSADETSDAYTDDTAEPVRRVKRLGEVVGENEWQPELTVPQAAGGSADAKNLPDEAQQQLLTDLLSRLASNPEDRASQDQLHVLLNDILAQAAAAMAAWQPDRAQNLLAVVKGVNPDHPGLATARLRLESMLAAEGQLTAAREAMAAGRIDQPDDDSALFFYQQVFDRFPGNEEAIRGLLAVRKDILYRAIEFAKETDFDAAESLLEDAAKVLGEQLTVDQARETIGKIKSDRVETLELDAIQLMDAGEFSASERKLIDLIALGGQSERVTRLRQRMEEAKFYGGFKPGQVIRDRFSVAGILAPELVIVTAGSYMMGSKPDEPGRVENEEPQHRVNLQRGFALGQREVSVAEFGAFVSLSGFQTRAERSGHSTVYDSQSGRIMEKEGVYWKMDFEGKPALPEDPVIHVSWDDAQAYVDWLASGTGKPYRLPSEAEFEFALRAGSKARYWWGDASPARVVENLTGEFDVSRERRSWAVAFSAYTDKFWGPAPVASFGPNPFGLFDMGGNVAEWVSDCWHDNYVRAPRDGSAWINPGCEQRVIRGGYWASTPDQTRSAYRHVGKSNYRDARVGFRIARDL